MNDANETESVEKMKEMVEEKIETLENIKKFARLPLSIKPSGRLRQPSRKSKSASRANQRGLNAALRARQKKKIKSGCSRLLTADRVPRRQCEVSAKIHLSPDCLIYQKDYRKLTGNLPARVLSRGLSPAGEQGNETPCSPAGESFYWDATKESSVISSETGTSCGTNEYLFAMTATR
jgi:hypothetical protein